MDGFASIASTLSILTQKRVKFEWSEACERNIEILKDSLTFAPMLTLPGIYRCIPSGLGVYSYATWKVVAYASRQLKVHEKNYLFDDLELEAVVFP